MLYLWLFLSNFLMLQQPAKEKLNFISNVKVETDSVYMGVIGMYISYELSLKELKLKQKNDSIVKTSQIIVKAVLTHSENKIKSNPGYGEISDHDGFLTPQVLQSGMNFFHSDTERKYIFIPYAAMSINTPNPILNIALEVSCKGKYSNEYEQIIGLKSVTIRKPPVYKATLDIDYIKVSERTPKNTLWDTDLPNNSAPDVSVKVYLATTLIWSDLIDDTYYYSRGTESKSITFYISQYDQIRFLVEDIDLTNHDFIGEQILYFNFKRLGKPLRLNRRYNSVTDCAATYKIERI